MGGVLSIKRWLEKRPHNPNPSGAASTDSRTRSALAFQAVTITTGFAALLAFQTIRFYRDFFKDSSGPFFPNLVLIVIAVLFVIACISNLVQILLHQYLDQKIWNESQLATFRQRLNSLRHLSWHCLLTSIILILSLLPVPWLWVCPGINFLYGLSLHWYYFSLKAPEGFPD